LSIIIPREDGHFESFDARLAIASVSLRARCPSIFAILFELFLWNLVVTFGATDSVVQ
jgi:hypothetical protein